MTITVCIECPAFHILVATPEFDMLLAPSYIYMALATAHVHSQVHAQKDIFNRDTIVSAEVDSKLYRPTTSSYTFRLLSTEHRHTTICSVLYRHVCRLIHQKSEPLPRYISSDVP